MPKDKSVASTSLSTELFDGDVKLTFTVRATGVNANVNQETVTSIRQAVQDKLLTLGSVVGSGDPTGAATE